MLPAGDTETEPFAGLFEQVNCKHFVDIIVFMKVERCYVTVDG